MATFYSGYMVHSTHLMKKICVHRASSTILRVRSIITIKEQNQDYHKHTSKGDRGSNTSIKQNENQHISCF